MIVFARPIVYGGLALVGIQVANALNPLAAGDVLGQDLGSTFSAIGDVLRGGGSVRDVGSAAAETAKKKIRNNIVAGVVGGVLVAAVVDALI